LLSCSESSLRVQRALILHFINISDAAKVAPSCADSLEASAGRLWGPRIPRMGVGHTLLTRLHVVRAIGVDSLVTSCTLAQGFSSAPSPFEPFAGRLTQRG
jgi:hypothetical protein